MTQQTETPSTEAPASAGPGEAKPAEGTTSGGAESTEQKPAETVPPEVLRQKLTEANAEAANYRTRLREAEAKLGAAKTTEEFDAVVTELRTQNATLERSILLNKVAGEYELPQVLADVLKGDDEEALVAHAKELQKLLAPAPASLGGGLTPDDGGDDIDPATAVRNARRRRY